MTSSRALTPNEEQDDVGRPRTDFEPLSVIRYEHGTGRSAMRVEHLAGNNNSQTSQLPSILRCWWAMCLNTRTRSAIGWFDGLHFSLIILVTTS
jgi:hypothetical protein